MPLPHSIDDSLVRARGALVGALSFARKESTNVKELPEFWPAASMVPVAVKPTPQAPRWCLLLTTSTRPTIDLRNLSYGRRQQRDAQVRRRLYRQVVRSYLKDLAVGSGLPMVVVENTADRVFMNMLRHDLSYNSSFSAGLSLEARKKVELLQFLPATTCSNEEIGCHEASNIHRAIRVSALFNRVRGQDPMCTHAIKGACCAPPIPAPSACKLTQRLWHARLVTRHSDRSLLCSRPGRRLAYSMQPLRDDGR